jgi:hypothetical protein
LAHSSASGSLIGCGSAARSDGPDVVSGAWCPAGRRREGERNLIAFQHILIQWTKDDRGPEDGAVRKALPRSLPFAPPGDPGGDWQHRIVFRSDDHYIPHERWQPGRPERRDGISVIPSPERADILFHRRQGIHLQKPSRPGFEGLVARLPFGMRLVIRLNTASDGEHQRLYLEHTIHIGFADVATLDLPLHREMDERVDLY